MKINANEDTGPELKLSTVGFSLTPALEQKVRIGTSRLRAEASRLSRVRAKLRLHTNGPRRDTFSVRLRLEQPGPDLVTEQEGGDLYRLIHKVSQTTLERLRQNGKRRQTTRRTSRSLPARQARVK